MAKHTIEELDEKGLRNFALSFGAVLVAVFGLVLPWAFSFNFPAWPWILWLVLAVWGVAAPKTLRPFYRGWMTFGLLLSRVTTPLVLGLFYYGVLTPTGLIARLFRSDPLQRDCNEACESFRVESPEKPHTHMENPF